MHKTLFKTLSFVGLAFCLVATGEVKAQVNRDYVKELRDSYYAARGTIAKSPTEVAEAQNLADASQTSWLFSFEIYLSADDVVDYALSNKLLPGYLHISSATTVHMTRVPKTIRENGDKVLDLIRSELISTERLSIDQIQSFESKSPTSGDQSRETLGTANPNQRELMERRRFLKFLDRQPNKKLLISGIEVRGSLIDVDKFFQKYKRDIFQVEPVRSGQKFAVPIAIINPTYDK